MDTNALSTKQYSWWVKPVQYDLFHKFIGVRDDLQTRFLITIEPQE